VTLPISGPWKVHPEHKGWEINPDGNIRKRKNITPDGRDVSGETWKTLKEFPNYQVTIGGDVRHRESHTVLLESVNRNGIAFYSLYKNKKSVSRNWKSLVYTTFSELHEGWKDVPGFPDYQVSKDGRVRGKLWWRELPSTNSGVFILRKDGARHRWTLNELGEDFWSGE
jgi:hypothetical protein